MVFYRNVDHNIADVPTQKYSMRLNLDWFDYWLDPAARDRQPGNENFKRWDAMQADMAAVRAENGQPTCPNQ
jgi:hypothetical protein